MSVAAAHLYANYELVSEQVIVVVVGRPAAQGSKRHVGGGRMIEQSAYVAPWREAVRAAALLPEVWAADVRPLLGPLSVVVTFTLAKPRSAPKRRRTFPDRAPDVDKLLRSTLDGLTSAGVWRDDAQVIELFGRKAYPGEHHDALTVPGAIVRINRIRVTDLGDGSGT
jgi:crossover junction endodeoxyribonuclease RusA